MIGKYSIVLPSYKPDEKLEITVKSFHDAGFDDIIVVDDGGGEEYKAIFDRIRALDYATVLVHPVNRGKGAALKTAFDYYIRNREQIGVITADGDGQHTPEDAVKIAEAMEKSGKIVLGARDFTQDDVPPRSKFGNNMTSGIFRVCVGMKITDTQTGFRGFPAKYLPKMCEIKGDRYEYETNVLLYMKRFDFPYEEVKIKTVYINENETSHFRPVRDSMRIYSLIIKFLITGMFVKFLGSSLLCFLIDYALFALSEFLLLKIAPTVAVALAYAIARIASSLVNFTLNRKIFQGGSIKKTIVRYYVLAVCILVCGSAAVTLLTGLAVGIPQIINLVADMPSDEAKTLISSVIKLPVDMLLFIASYTVQKKYVFKKEQ